MVSELGDDVFNRGNTLQRLTLVGSLLPIEYPNCPYFLHHSDSLGYVVITPPLTGPNYFTWSRAFLLAVTFKNKFRFLDGNIPKPRPGDILFQHWVRCNNLIVPWIAKSVSQSIASNIFSMDLTHLIWEIIKKRFYQPEKSWIISCSICWKILCNEIEP